MVEKIISLISLIIDLTGLIIAYKAYKNGK